MKKTTLLTAISLAFAASLLTACHENPLKTHSKSKSATFLVAASADAEKKLRLKIDADSLGGVYTDCMEERAGKTDCKALYKAMIAFASSGKNTDFKTLTWADLTDELVFEDLRDRYEEALLTFELEG